MGHPDLGYKATLHLGAALPEPSLPAGCIRNAPREGTVKSNRISLYGLLEHSCYFDIPFCNPWRLAAYVRMGDLRTLHTRSTSLVSSCVVSLSGDLRLRIKFI